MLDDMLDVIVIDPEIASNAEIFEAKVWLKIFSE